MITTHNPEADISAFPDEWQKTARPKVIATSKPAKPQISRRFTLNQRCFSSGETLLILDRSPVLSVFPETFELEVVGWGIKVPFAKLDQIGREIVRKFVGLFGKAERSELDEYEEAEWAEIIKQVDYRKFCIERAPYRYVEGVLKRSSERETNVIWHDGSTETIASSITHQLNIVNNGERFSAMAKFGEGNRLVSIMNVVLLSPLRDGEEMWQSWPTNRS